MACHAADAAAVQRPIDAAAAALATAPSAPQVSPVAAGKSAPDGAVPSQTPATEIESGSKTVLAPADKGVMVGGGRWVLGRSLAGPGREPECLHCFSEA